MVAASTVLAVCMFFVLDPSSVFARQEAKTRARPWLGVSIQDVTERVAKENKMGDQTGAYVNEVNRHSPADSVGIERGDVIVEFGKNKIDDADGLIRAVKDSKVGDKVEIVVLRKGEKKSFQAVLAKYPSRLRFAYSIEDLGHRLRVFAGRENQGMRLMELNDQLGEYFGVPKGTGILVERVEKGSAAEKAGIKAGDVLLRIGKRNIDDMEDVSKALSNYDDGDKVDVEVLRKDAHKTLTLEISQDQEGPVFDIFRHRSPDGEEFLMPWFKGKIFEFPHWNDEEYRIELSDPGPDMEILRQNIEEMTKGLKENQRNLEENMRLWRMRTI